MVARLFEPSSLIFSSYLKDHPARACIEKSRVTCARSKRGWASSNSSKGRECAECTRHVQRLSRKPALFAQKRFPSLLLSPARMMRRLALTTESISEEPCAPLSELMDVSAGAYSEGVRHKRFSIPRCSWNNNTVDTNDVEQHVEDLRRWQMRQQMHNS